MDVYGSETRGERGSDFAGACKSRGAWKKIARECEKREGQANG